MQWMLVMGSDCHGTESCKPLILSVDAKPSKPQTSTPSLLAAASGEEGQKGLKIRIEI